MKKTLITLLTLSIISCYENVDDLKQQATTFAKDLGYNIKGVYCANKDNDKDGYVSCSLNIENAEPVAIECRSRWKLGNGCRIQKTSILQRIRGWR